MFRVKTRVLSEKVINLIHLILDLFFPLTDGDLL